MKKNILFILSVLIFNVSFVSCSSDDDDDNDNTNEPTTNGLTCSRNYVDDAVYAVFKEETSYNSQSKKLLVNFDFVVNTADIFGDYHLTLRFATDYDLLKVGDELQSKIEYVRFKMRFKSYTIVGDIGYDNYIKSGKVIVKAIDITNKTISIEFQNLDIWREQSYLGGDLKEMKEIIIKKGVLDLRITK